MKLFLLLLCSICSYSMSSGIPVLLRGNHKYRYQVRKGSPVSLKCPYRSDDNMYEWDKDGESIMDIYSTHSVNPKTGTLKIKNVTLEDAGSYVCKVTNGFGNAEFRLTVIVLGTPEFSNPEDMSHSKIQGSIGARRSLKCKASGNPKPKFTWTKNGKTLSRMNDRDEIIFPSLKSSDAGNYQCYVTNTHGRINFVYTLEVIGRLTKPVVVLQSPSNLSISQGQTVLLQCQVMSDEKPNIIWLKEGQHSDEGENIQIGLLTYHVVKNEGEIEMMKQNSYTTSYKVENFDNKDAAYYVCRATNSVGSDSKFVKVLMKLGGYTEQESSIMENTSIALLVGIPVALVSIIVIIASLTIYKRHSNGKQNQSQTSQLRPSRSPLSSVPSGYSAGSTSLKQASLTNQQMDSQQQIMYNQQQSIAQQQQNLAQQQYFLQQQRLQYQNAMITAHQYQLSNDQSNGTSVVPPPAQNRDQYNHPSSSSCSQGYQPLPVTEPYRPSAHNYTDSYSESDTHSHNPVYTNQYGA